MGILNSSYTPYPFSIKKDFVTTVIAKHINDLQDAVNEIVRFLRQPGALSNTVWDVVVTPYLSSRNVSVQTAIEEICGWLDTYYSGVSFPGNALKVLRVNVTETGLEAVDAGDAVADASNTVGDKTTTQMECSRITFSDDTYIETATNKIKYEFELDPDEQYIIDLGAGNEITDNKYLFQLLEKPTTVIPDDVNYDLYEGTAQINWNTGDLLSTDWTRVTDTGSQADGYSHLGRTVLYLVTPRDGAGLANGAHKINCGPLDASDYYFRLGLRTSGLGAWPGGAGYSNSLWIAISCSALAYIHIQIFSDGIYYLNLVGGTFVKACDWTEDVYHDIVFNFDGSVAGDGIAIKNLWVDGTLEGSSFLNSMRGSACTPQMVTVYSYSTVNTGGNEYIYIDKMALGTRNYTTYAVPVNPEDYTLELRDGRYLEIVNNRTITTSLVGVLTR